MSQLLDQLSNSLLQTSGTLDDKARRLIIDKLRELQYALEPPFETLQRLMPSHLIITSIRISLELKIFDMLCASPNPVSLQELSDRTKADPVLLGRILRHQASLLFINETSKDTFAANHTTRNLSIPEIQAGLYFFNDVLGPAFQAMPDFLAERGYQNPTNILDTPFHKAYNAPFWQWVHQRPREAAHFDLSMKGWRAGLPNCFEMWNIEKDCVGWPGKKPVFVDIGGGAGLQCQAIQERFPKLSGKVILQDLPNPIEEAQVPPGVEKMAYDFFTEQPIKDARFYYLRAVMHDHGDDKCREILKNQIAAMGPESTLVLDEIVCPDVGVNWFIPQVDLSMMLVFSSFERTKTQWETLLGEAGLVVEKMECYESNFNMSLIFARKL